MHDSEARILNGGKASKSINYLKIKYYVYLNIISVVQEVNSNNQEPKKLVTKQQQKKTDFETILDFENRFQETYQSCFCFSVTYNILSIFFLITI